MGRRALGARVTRLLIIVPAIALAGCWAQAGSGPSRQAQNPFEVGLTRSTVGGLQEAWSRSLGTSAVKDPVIANNRVFAANANSLNARYAGTGDPLWSTGPTSIYGTPAIVGDQAYLPFAFFTFVPGGLDNGGGLRVLDVATGSLITTHTAPTVLSSGVPASGAAAESEGVVVTAWNGAVINNEAPFEWEIGGLFAVDRATGATWKQENDPRGPGGKHTGTPAINAGLVYAPFIGGQVRAYPLHCANALGCPPVWTTDLGANRPTDPMVDANGDVVVGASDGVVRVLDGATGALEWSSALGFTLSVPVARSGNWLFAATNTGKLYALPANGCGAPTCPFAWTADLGAPPSSGPSIGADVVYVGTQAGNLFAFPRDGCGTPICTPLRTIAVGSSITGRPAIAYSRVFVGTADGRLIAYGLP